MTNMTDQLLLTTDQASKALAISPRTLWSLTHRAGLPFVRIGRLIRYEPADLAAWIEMKKKQEVLPIAVTPS
jgi:excisionase family DNA binding protein